MERKPERHTAWQAVCRSAWPPVQSLRRVLHLCAYSASCVLLHGLLQQHYFSHCRASWLALFSLDSGPYCALVRKGLVALQWSPLLVSGLWAPQDLLLPLREA